MRGCVECSAVRCGAVDDGNVGLEVIDAERVRAVHVDGVRDRL